MKGRAEQEEEDYPPVKAIPLEPASQFQQDKNESEAKLTPKCFSGSSYLVKRKGRKDKVCLTNGPGVLKKGFLKMDLRQGKCPIKCSAPYESFLEDLVGLRGRK